MASSPADYPRHSPQLAGPGSRHAELAGWLAQLDEAELLLVGAALESPLAAAAARQVVGVGDFADPLLRMAWKRLETLPELPGEGATGRCVRLAERLVAEGLAPDTLRRLGVVFAEAVDAGDADTFSAHGAVQLARLVRRQRLREQLTLAAHTLAADPSSEQLTRVAGLGAALDALSRSDDTPTYATTGTTGQALLEASSTLAPSPIVEGLLWPGHVNVLAGASKIGKTFLALAVLRAITTGERPWPGLAPCERGRVLVLSRDDTTAEIARRLRMLDPADTAWAERLVVVGKEQLPAALDPRGMGELERTLTLARREASPFAGVVIDPLSLFTPGDINREQDVAPVLEALEQLCLAEGVWIWILHHVRKMPGDSRRAAEATDDDQAIFDSVRGSAAIVQIARAIAVLTKPEPHIRRISPRSNLGPARPTELEVCPRGEGDTRYLKPAASAVHPITQLFGPDEPFTFSDFVRRSEGIPAGSDPSNAAKRRHRSAWDDALRRCLITPAERVRHHQYYRLTEATPATGHDTGHDTGHGASDTGHAPGALKSPVVASGRCDAGHGGGRCDLPDAPRGTDDLEW